MIGHNPKFIFVHIAKTGGSSIEKALGPFTQGRAWIYKHEVLCTHPGGVPKHSIIEQCQTDPNDYFKFSLVRNPWDLVVSHYFFERAPHKSGPSPKKTLPLSSILATGPRIYGFGRIRTPALPFKDWVIKTNKETYSKDGHSTVDCQLDWLSDAKGEIRTDFIGKLENIKQDFNIICDKIGIPRQQLPHTNKTKHKHYTRYYDDETRKIVSEIFAKDIEYFGYKFGE